MVFTYVQYLVVERMYNFKCCTVESGISSPTHRTFVRGAIAKGATTIHYLARGKVADLDQSCSH